MITTSQKAQIIAALDQGREQTSWFRDLPHFGPGVGPTRITPGALAAAQITGADPGTPQHRAVWLVLALASHPEQLLGEVDSAKSIGSWARDLCRSRGEDGKLHFNFNHGLPAETLFQSLVAGSQRAQGGDEALIIRLVRQPTPDWGGLRTRPDPMLLVQDLCQIYTPPTAGGVHAPRWEVMVRWMSDFHPSPSGVVEEAGV